jgi:hypothetical protein
MGDTPGVDEVRAASLQDYWAPQFIGDPIRADEDFFWALDILNTIAEANAVQIYVTSSFRDSAAILEQAIVEPARTSNHLVGHAIDMNLKSANGFFDSQRLRRSNLPSLPSEIRDVIEGIRGNPILRWGGDFELEDPVHVDDNLNQRDKTQWLAKYRVLHPVVYAEGAVTPTTPNIGS